MLAGVSLRLTHSIANDTLLRLTPSGDTPSNRSSDATAASGSDAGLNSPFGYDATKTLQAVMEANVSIGPPCLEGQRSQSKIRAGW